MTGLLHGAWVIAHIIIKLTRVQRDEVYIGTPEDRAKLNAKDDPHQVEAKAGHIAAQVDIGDEPPSPSWDDDDYEDEKEAPMSDEECPLSA